MQFHILVSFSYGNNSTMPVIFMILLIVMGVQCRLMSVISRAMSVVLRRPPHPFVVTVQFIYK
jgi:hypothetical protein